MGECGLQYMGQCVSRGRVQWAPPLPRVALAQCAVTWDGKRERGRVGVLGVFVVKATITRKRQIHHTTSGQQTTDSYPCSSSSPQPVLS